MRDRLAGVHSQLLAHIHSDRFILLNAEQYQIFNIGVIGQPHILF